MSQMWHRMRGMIYPGPETGGIEQAEWDPNGDVSPPEDNFSRLHNPQAGRVPPQLPSPPSRPQWPQFPTLQYARYFTVTPATLNSSLSFQAQSVRVDNYSGHWIYLTSAGVYIPPFVYGTIIWLDPAVATAQWQLTPPLGHSDGATPVESQVVTIWYETPQPAAVGFSVPAT
jgi:hypothetical protein